MSGLLVVTTSALPDPARIVDERQLGVVIKARGADSPLATAELADIGNALRARAADMQGYVGRCNEAIDSISMKKTLAPVIEEIAGGAERDGNEVLRPG
jgi:hypothetical protein